MHIHYLVAILLFAASIASADVSISNSYYTGETECREDVFLHNMDYSNSVTIDQANFNAGSNATTADDSGTGRFTDRARMSSELGSQGVSVAADADDLGYSRSLQGGYSKYISLSYFLETGTAHSSYFTPKSLFNEEMVLDNCRYKGTALVYDSRSYSLGYGTPVSDAPSSFTDNITMYYLDKKCRLWSNLSSYGEASEDIPVDYRLRSYSWEGNYARAGINITAAPGNRNMILKINGTATYLGNKSSPDPKKSPLDKYPLKYVPISEYVPTTLQPVQKPRDILVEFGMAAGIPKNLTDE